ncbi:hypothetical protein AGMMS49957_01970 [Synergistales bacterium]|nr:hypothetical protein AGMMS49957_01970 [Synergistales bacterium]
MLREAIEKIVELAKVDVIEVEGNSFIAAKDGSGVQQIRPDTEFPKTLNLYSLDALVQMVKTEAPTAFTGPFYINAQGHDDVICYTQPLDVLRKRRGELYTVKAKDIPGWEENVQFSFEEALIAIRTRFQQTPDSDYLLKLLSDITNGAKITFTDNGIASTVVSQKGIALQENAVIRPIVRLKPYRTFQEVDKPESEFHIRVSERGIKFVEADGGMWKLTARRTVADYLAQKLDEMVEAGEVIVTI